MKNTSKNIIKIISCLIIIIAIFTISGTVQADELGLGNLDNYKSEGRNISKF